MNLRTKEAFKRLLAGHPSLFNIIRKSYRTLFPVYFPPYNADVVSALKAIFDGRQNVFFIQVGSNDGTTMDPFYDLVTSNKSWRGILIEPVPYLFDRLCANYNNDTRFIFVNKAISDSAKQLPFYYISADAEKSLKGIIPSYYEQLGSFDRNHLVKYTGTYIEPFIMTVQVACTTLDAALEEHSISQIDLIDIDTEGHDFKVLSQLNLDKYHPLAIVYEHKLLSDKEQAMAVERLSMHGYVSRIYGDDTIAVDKSTQSCLL